MQQNWDNEDKLSEHKISQLEKKHHQFTFRINTMLCIAHVCLFMLFSYLHVTLMMYINVISVFVYLALYFYYKKNLINYVFIVFIEVLVHMSFATACVGMNGGFQFYSFCLIPCIFLCDYLSKTDGRKTMHPILTSMAVIAVFIAIRVYCYVYGPAYHVGNEDGFLFLYIYNVLVSFVFLIVYMYVFEKRILSKERMLGDMASFDQLTQLPNRYLMKNWLADAYDEIGREKSLAIAMMDIDDFKTLNDTYGHAVGDEVLVAIANCLKEKETDTMHFSRWGGEEFVLMATGKEAYQKLYQTMDEIRSQVSRIQIVQGAETISTTVTIGLAQQRSKDRSFEDILKRADERLYVGKSSGKNVIIGKE